MTTGSLIKNAIRAIGMTLDDAAKKIDMSRSGFYYQINKQDPDKDFIEKISTILGIQLTASSNIVNDPHAIYKTTKDIEIENLQRSLSDKETIIKSLQIIINEKDKRIALLEINIDQLNQTQVKTSRRHSA